MAKDPKPTPKLTPHANRRREVKELKTKLTNLSPLATAEVVNDAVSKSVSKQVTGFTDFLREQSVVGIGIGIVFGAQVKVVVDAIMAGFVNPITQLMLPGSGGLAKQTFQLSFDGKTVAIGWGAIVYSLITFVLVAIIIYAAYKLLKLDRLKKQDKKK